MSERILTTHVGSLPYLESLDPSAADYAVKLRAEVQGIITRQREIGLDIINEGEHAKADDWLSYLDSRFSGFEEGSPPDGKPLIQQGLDRETFADFYAWVAERNAQFFSQQMRSRRKHWVCTAPVAYIGHEALRREIEVLKLAADTGSRFLTATAPASIEVYRTNSYYPTQEAFVFALAEALREEYEAIAAAGVLVQIDDAWPPALWDRIGVKMGMPAFKKYLRVRTDALNHALRNIPEEQVRYHLCWGSWHGPHAFDIEMADMVEVMLAVKAKYYSFEAANARHEHEFAVWDTVKLPAGKVLMPGVVSHATDIVEHPDLVALRICRFAERVGRENVIASTDCGFGGRTHPQVVWAKLASLTEGARRATARL
jgi:5-methyltetrahydropteroyltriglutamate--homocysteine methyltransferase